jgi:16S rRNA (cytosine967-C5)-methyltransferase
MPEKYPFTRRRRSVFHSVKPTQISARILRESSREKPADAVLRETLKRTRDLAPFDAAEISKTVFAYFRWRGWLDAEKTIETQIPRALELASRFHRDPFSFPLEELRAKVVPNWISDEIEISDNWLRALQTEPKLWLRAKRGHGIDLAKKFGDCRVFSEVFSDTLEYFGEMDLFRTPEFHAGEFELQDISSQAVGLICNPKSGETWWDACAGEGGKLLHLSELMENKGLIWASDRAGWRLQKLKRRTARAKVFNYRSTIWDGGAKLPTKTKFDGVLVDAPCSGIGTWQRNPHARWTLTSQDVKELSAIQMQLLSNAAATVKPGGKLIYSVCTLTQSETNKIADEFESRFPDFKPLRVENPLCGEASKSARIWIWPQDCGGNGMFIAIWEKTAK